MHRLCRILLWPTRACTAIVKIAGPERVRVDRGPTSHLQASNGGMDSSKYLVQNEFEGEPQLELLENSTDLIGDEKSCDTLETEFISIIVH